MRAPSLDAFRFSFEHNENDNVLHYQSVININRTLRHTGRK